MKEQLIKHALSRAAVERGVIEATESPALRRQYCNELVLHEIALAALTAVPVGYINRHTGVFHKPESMPVNALDAALYFPVFGAHRVVAAEPTPAEELTSPITDSELSRLIWGLKAEGNSKRQVAALVELQQRRNADQQPVPEVMICDMCGHDAWLQEHGTYECDEGHLFEVRRTPISKGGAA